MFNALMSTFTTSATGPSALRCAQALDLPLLPQFPQHTPDGRSASPIPPRPDPANIHQTLRVFVQNLAKRAVTLAKNGVYTILGKTLRVSPREIPKSQYFFFGEYLRI